MQHWRESLPQLGSTKSSRWTRVEVRAGAKGPLKVDIVSCRVEARHKRRVGPEELLVVIRRRDDLGKSVYDYHLSNAPPETPLPELARAADAHHRVEECLQRSKSQAGLADYQLRSYAGWYHHQTLSLIAVWFLVRESRRGKKQTPALTVPQVREGLSALLRIDCDDPVRLARERTRRLERNELARLYHWKQRNRLPPLNIERCLI